MRVIYVASLAAVLLIFPAGLRAAEEVLLEGFEQAGTYQASPKAQPVKGADAVTQGSSALQLPPEGEVVISIPAKAIPLAGWIKVDTFVGQPSLAEVELRLDGVRPANGYAASGKDTLVMPLLMANRADWPAAPLKLHIINHSDAPLVVDNVRLAPPSAAPAGAVLLDFGHDDNVWPGFQSANGPNPAFQWSGNGVIVANSSTLPDPLLGDFAGPNLAPKAQDSIIFKADPKVDAKGMTGVLFFSHYCHGFSQPAEYYVKMGNTMLTGQKVAPPQFLPNCTLAGKDGTWTSDWLDKTFIPHLVSRVDVQLPPGDSKLDLLNCQPSAAVLFPAKEQAALKAYMARLDDDLKRYHRQFSIGAQNRLRSTVAPTDAETKAGVMLFAPQPDDYYSRTYAGKVEDRIKTIKLTLPAGITGYLPVAAVPIADAQAMQLSFETLSDGSTTLATSGVKAILLESLPVVDKACVVQQPFVQAKVFKNLQGRGVYWACLQIGVQDKASAGTYRGNLKVMVAQTSSSVPVEIEVVKLAGQAPKNGENLLNVVFDLDNLYRAGGSLLPQGQHPQVARDLIAHMQGLGFSGNVIPGPALGANSAADTAVLSHYLKEHLYLSGGREFIDLRWAVLQMNTANIQRGTARYTTAVGNLVKASIDLAQKAGINNYAILIGQAGAGNVAEMSALAAAVKAASGKAAVFLGGDFIAMPAAQRDELLKNVDVIFVPADANVLGLVTEFKKTAGRAAYLTCHPDAYATGFYLWATATDGLFMYELFSEMPQYDAFYFDGRSLLVPTAAENGLVPPFKQSYEETLAMLNIQQGSEDCQLALWCESLVKAAKGKQIDASALDKLLTTIRTTCDGKGDAFDPAGSKSRHVANKQLADWRAGLIAEGGKLSAIIAAAK